MVWTRSADPQGSVADGQRDPARGRSGAARQSDPAWADVVAKISHDIRTPLNAVIGFADLMRRELHGDLGHDRYREYVGHIHDCGADLLRAAEETLLVTVLLGSPDAMARESVCLQELVDDVVAQIGCGAVPAAVDVEAMAPGGILVLLDRRAARLALGQLMRSALAEAPAHAIVRIASVSEHGVARLDVTLERPAGDAAAVRAVPSRVNDAEVLLARAILRLQGAELIDGSRTGGPLFSVLMETAAQPDFFANH